MDIQSSIPHREPFLFVDEVIEKTEKTLVAIKYFTGEEEFYRGHFPSNPVTPGVLMLESLLQSGAILMSQGTVEAIKKVPVVTRINNVKFKNLVTPPASLRLEVELTELIDNVAFFKGKVKVDSKLAVSCEFSCALVERS